MATNVFFVLLNVIHLLSVLFAEGKTLKIHSRSNAIHGDGRRNDLEKLKYSSPQYKRLRKHRIGTTEGKFNIKLKTAPNVIKNVNRSNANRQSLENSKQSIWGVKRLYTKYISYLRRIKKFIKLRFGFNSTLSETMNEGKGRGKRSFDYKTLMKSLKRNLATALYNMFCAIYELRDCVGERDIVEMARRPKVGLPKTLTKIAVTKASKKIKSKIIKEAILKLYDAVFPENVHLKEIPSFGIVSQILKEIATLFKPSQ